MYGPRLASAQKIHNCLEKFLRQVDVNPVTCLRQGYDLGLRENPADQPRVIICNIIRTAAADEQARFVEGSLRRKPAEKLIVIPLDRFQMDFPAQTATLISGQILEQKLPQRRIWNFFRQSGIGFAKRVVAWQIQRTQGLQHSALRRFVGLRSYIDDNQLIDAVGMVESELHSNFSTERMAQKHDAGEGVLLDEFAQIGNHDIVVKNLAVRGSTVVAQIYGENFVMSAEAPAHRAPVVGRAEKTV